MGETCFSFEFFSLLTMEKKKTGFLIEMEYNVETDRNLTFSFRFSSEVNVVPDTFPFPDCPQSMCNNPPSK
jgi:hypothetical protein